MGLFVIPHKQIVIASEFLEVVCTFWLVMHKRDAIQI